MSFGIYGTLKRFVLIISCTSEVNLDESLNFWEIVPTWLLRRVRIMIDRVDYEMAPNLIAICKGYKILSKAVSM